MSWGKDGEKTEPGESGERKVLEPNQVWGLERPHFYRELPALPEDQSSVPSTRFKQFTATLRADLLGLAFVKMFR